MSAIQSEKLTSSVAGGTYEIIVAENKVKIEGTPKNGSIEVLIQEFRCIDTSAAIVEGQC